MLIVFCVVAALPEVVHRYRRALLAQTGNPHNPRSMGLRKQALQRGTALHHHLEVLHLALAEAEVEGAPSANNAEPGTVNDAATLTSQAIRTQMVPKIYAKRQRALADLSRLPLGETWAKAARGAQTKMVAEARSSRRAQYQAMMTREAGNDRRINERRTLSHNAEILFGATIGGRRVPLLVGNRRPQ